MGFEPGQLSALERTLAQIPLNYAGPGGAIAVLKDGEVLVRHAWGYADLERRIAFTPQTLFRICSISKQFTCGLLLDQFPDPNVLDDDVRARMPRLTGDVPHITHLAHNQSGLRDYWATAMLCGSPIEAPFGDEQARTLIAKTASLHFAPGSRYSYCNQNFRILGDILTERAGRPFEEMLRTRIFNRAEMPTAQLCADTHAMPDGTTGYEGTLESGFRPAVNRIVWTGDAGLGASLDDMIAWERFIDATRDDAGGLYRKLAAPQSFSNGAPAQYGFGLSRVKLLGRPGTGHGGGLRGWRSFRFNLPAERISMVVLFNHMADPRAAALDLLAHLIPAPTSTGAGGSAAAWDGNFIEPESGVLVRLTGTPDHRVRLQFAQSPELLDLGRDDEARSGTIALRRTAEGIRMERAAENLTSLLQALPEPGPMPEDIEGRYHCAELGAVFDCAISGGAPYGGFSGFLGEGPMQSMLPAGPDIWRLPMPRALDHAPPGDWTIRFMRNAEGQITQAIIGCWLARGLIFQRE
jgi:D-aminopeptidase